MTYGDRVKAARNERGWSREYLALECGMNTRTLARIEDNEWKPSVVSYRKLTDALGVL